MPRNIIHDRTRLLYKISNLYYIESNTQQEIAEKLGLSRPMVSRLLKQAREEGIVQINILPMRSNHHQLESALEEKYGLKEVIVVDMESTHSQWFISKQIGISATEHFLRTVKNNDTIGLTWGTTLRALADAMHPTDINNLHLVQILGGLGSPGSDLHPSSICTKLASLLNCSFTIFPSPGVAGSKETKVAYLSDTYVSNALKIIKQVNVAYVGIGSMADDTIIVKENIISPEDRKYLKKKGAVGDIGLRFFDIDGNAVQSNFDERVIGANLDEIKKIPRVIGLAGGPQKFKAVLGALKGKYIKVLITDENLAKKLKEEI